MRIGPALALAALLEATGCTTGRTALYGSYVAYGPASEVATPPVTLELTRPDRYRFCDAGRCTAGRFTLLPVPAADNGRITFQGPAVEAYARSVSAAAFGPSEAERQRGVRGAIDLSYSTGPVGAQISLGAGDAAFVKR